MDRVESPARPDWPAKLEEIGLTYHSGGIEPQPGTEIESCTPSLL